MIYYIKFIRFTKKSERINNKEEMNAITVKPIFVNDVTGEESPFYDETGTPEFYMITHTLQKHLGEGIWIYNDDVNTELFVINEEHTGADEDIDEGYDKSADYIYIIQKINELNTLKPKPIWRERCPSTHIRFEIIH